MTLNRYAARVDSTQAPIIRALQEAGASVHVIRQPVDLLVGASNRTALFEVKRDAKAPYTPLQRDFMQTWSGGPVFTVWDVEGALRALATLRSG